MTDIEKKFLASEIVNRLTDNYEDKGDFIQEFYQLQDLIIDACRNSPHLERIIQLALDNGVIEEENEHGL